MEKILLYSILFFTASMTSYSLEAQCVTFDEDDFNPLTILATETMMTPASVTSNQIDIWDVTNNNSTPDGTADVEITMNAGVFNPNTGACADGDFSVGGAIGSNPLPNPGFNSSSDFGGSTNNDCVCESGYVSFTYTFINGFSSTAAGLNAAFTSVNGSTEGVEAFFGYVNAGTLVDQTTALTGLPSVTLSNLSSFCNAEYNDPTTSISMHVGATGAGSFAVDEQTGISNNCITSGQRGEDTGSGDNPNDNSNIQAEAANFGLNPDDIITEFTVVWVFSNASGTDCDGDGDTGVGTNPSASIGNVTVCPPPPPCGITAELIITEDCGVYDVEISNVAFNGTADGYTVGISTSETGVFTTIGNTYTDGSNQEIMNVTLPGTPGVDTYYIELTEDSEANCSNIFGPITAPKANVPSCTPVVNP